MIIKISLAFLIKVLSLVILVRGEDCSIYNQWCSDKTQHILCDKTNNRKLEAPVMMISNILPPINNLLRNDSCRRLNNGKNSLEVDGYLQRMAAKSLSYNLVNTDICYATGVHQYIKEIYRSTYRAESLETRLILTLSFPSSRILIQNAKSIGCAYNLTGTLCLLSGQDMFTKFSNSVQQHKRNCELDYSEINPKICYLHDPTIKNITAGLLQSSKQVQWNLDLEYSAQLRILFIEAVCDSYQSINASINITDTGYNIKEIVNNIPKFDVLSNDRKFYIGCAVYDLQLDTFRLLCLFHPEPISSMPDSEHPIFLYWALCGTVILLFIIMVTISYYPQILFKTKHTPTMEELYQMHEYSTIGPPQNSATATRPSN